MGDGLTMADRRRSSSEMEVTGPVCGSSSCVSSASRGCRPLPGAAGVRARRASEVGVPGLGRSAHPAGRSAGCAPRIASSMPRTVTLPYRPYHTHDDEPWPLTPGDPVYELDIEIWPTCIVVPAGYCLALDIRGSDFARSSSDDTTMWRGSGPWLHDDSLDRPPGIFAGSTTVHTGPATEFYLLIPIIPKRRERT